MPQIQAADVRVGYYVRIPHRGNDWCSVIAAQQGWLRLQPHDGEAFSMPATQYPTYELHEISEAYAVDLLSREFGAVIIEESA